MLKTICQQETVGCNAQGGVMMKATPAPSLVVAQSQFLAITSALISKSTFLR